MGRFMSEILMDALAVVQAVLIILPLLLGIMLYFIEWKVKRKEYENLPSLRNE